MVWGRGALLSVGILIFAAASAQAQTRVETTGTDSGNCIASPCKTIQYAVDKTAVGDTVFIGAGTFNEGVFFPAGMNVRGKGPALTKIVAFTSTNPEHGIFTNWGGRFEDFSVTGGASTVEGTPGGAGFFYHPVGTNTPLVLDNVVATGGGQTGTGSPGPGLSSFPTDATGTGSITATDSVFSPGGGVPRAAAEVSLPKGSSAFRRSTFNQPVPNSGRYGLHIFSGGTHLVEDSTSQGIRLELGVLTVERSRSVTGVGGPVALKIGQTSTEEPVARATVRNSLLSTTGNGVPAIQTEVALDGSDFKLDLTGSTILTVPSGDDVSPGLTVPGTATSPVRVSVANTVFWQGPGVGDATDISSGAPLTVRNSFYDKVQNFNAGNAPAPGTAGNFNGNPGLDANSRLLPGSKLIDRGLPSGGLDLLRGPRSVDGNGDCAAAPDIGAFELQGRAASCPVAKANIAPAISSFGLSKKSFRSKRKKGSRKKLGTSFRFTLSEAARITISLQREAAGRKRGKKCRKPSRKNRKAKKCTRLLKAGTVRADGKPGVNVVKFSGKIKGKALAAARYRATLTATDSAGLRTKSKAIKFRIVKP